MVEQDEEFSKQKEVEVDEEEIGVEIEP